MQVHIAAEPHSSNGTSSSATDPRILFGQKIDVVLDRLAKADVSWRSPFTNFRHGQRTLALHVDDAGALLAPLLADEPVSLASCQPTIEAKPPRRSDAADAQSTLDIAFPEPDDAVVDAPLFGRGRPRGQRRERTYTDVCAALNKEQRAIDRELGLHTLYLLMGQATWSEIGKPDDLHHSPLLFVPISLVVEDAEWRMRYQEDEVAFVNHVLLKNIAAQMADAQRLAPFMADFDIDSEGQTFDDLVERLYAAVPPTVSEAMHLAFDPTFLAVAIVKSSNYILYQDLASLSERMLADPDLIHLFTADELAGFDEAAAFERRRATLDARPTTETINVLDLDSSQQVALAKAADGDSFILQDPPGTGKSQTIANIIAQTLYQGRTVLFVSKKQEALDVVERRLDEAGLGDYLLTMHAVRTGTKAEMIHRLQQSLARYEAMGIPQVAAGTSPVFDRIDVLRDELNGYGDALLTPESTSGQRPYDVLGRISLRSVSGVPSPASAFPPTTDALVYVANDRKMDDATIEHLVGFGDYFLAYTTNRWLHARSDTDWERWQREQYARIDAIAEAAGVAQREGSRLLGALTTPPMPSTVDVIERAIGFVEQIAARPASVEHWLTAGGLGDEGAATFAELSQAWTQRCQRRAALDARVAKEFHALDHAAVLAQLRDIDPLRRRFVADARADERLYEQRGSLAAHIDPRTLDGLEARLARVGVPLGPSLDDLFALTSLFTLLAERPTGFYSEAMLTNPALPTLMERAEQSWRAYGAAWGQVAGRYDPMALGEDLDGLYSTIVNADGFFERRSASYRDAIDRLQRVRLDRLAPSREEALADLTTLRQVRFAQMQHGAALAALTQVYPLMPQDASEWQVLAQRGGWLAKAQSTVALTPQTLALLTQPDAAIRSILADRETIEQAATAWGRAVTVLRTASPESLHARLGVTALPRAALLAWCRETHQALAAWTTVIDGIATLYLPGAQPSTLATLESDLAAAGDICMFDAHLAANGEAYRRRFGPLWQGAGTDWERLGGLIRWWRTVEGSPWWPVRAAGLINALRDGGDCRRLVEGAALLQAALATLHTGCAALRSVEVHDVPSVAGDETIGDVRDATHRLREDLDNLGLAHKIVALREQAAQRPVLDAFLQWAAGRVSSGALRDAWAQFVDVAWMDAFLKRERDRPGTHQPLARFDRPLLEQRRGAFARDDARVPEENRDRVRQRLDERISDAVNAAQQTRYSREATRTGDEVKYLHTIYQQSRTIRDMRLRTRKSVRRVLVENGALVRLIAPC